MQGTYSSNGSCVAARKKEDDDNIMPAVEGIATRAQLLQLGRRKMMMISCQLRKA